MFLPCLNLSRVTNKLESMIKHSHMSMMLQMLLYTWDLFSKDLINASIHMACIIEVLEKSYLLHWLKRK
jgi:hypothetical protein